MAWGGTHTFVTGELVTAATMNNYLTNNVAFLHGDVGPVTLVDTLLFGPSGAALRGHRQPRASQDAHIEAGKTGSTSVPSNTVKSVAVTFTNPFASPPNVVIGLDATLSRTLTPGVNSISNTGCTVAAFNFDGSSAAIDINWVAEGVD